MRTVWLARAGFDFLIGLEADEAFADGVFDEFGAVVEVELLHEVGAVGFDGFDGDDELLGDLAVGEAVGDEGEDFAFAFGEAVEAVAGFAFGGALHVVAEDVAGDGGGEVGFAGGGGADAFDKFFGGGVLENVAAAAGAEDFVEVGVIVVHGEGDDADGGEEVVDASGGGDAVEFGHADVHDDDLGLEFFGEGDGFEAVFGFADDFEVGFGVEEEADAAADDGVVIGEEDVSDAAGGAVGARFCHDLLYLVGGEGYFPRACSPA